MYSSIEIESVLVKARFHFFSQKGSQGKFKNSRGNVVILPMNKKEIPAGTFRSILKQSELTIKEFEEKLIK